MTTHDVAPTRSRRSTRWLWIVLGGVIIAAVLSRGPMSLFGGGQSDPGPPVAGVTEVAVRDDFFVPAAIEVPAGTTVTWQWEGNNQHNVVGDGFESPVQDQGEFAYTFSEPGTYDYRCTLHGGMNGEVLVTAAAA